MIPLATYRLQFRGDMDFAKAMDLIPYLQQLGVSHLYASPVYAAVADSTHGYDIIDHNLIEPSLGGLDGFIELSNRLKSAGLGLILDIVPNHMAASLQNRWWHNVVEWGVESPFAGHFDVDWRRKLSLPILGREYERALSENELSVRFDPQSGNFALAYFDNLLPLNPPSYHQLIASLGSPIAQRIADLASRARSSDEAWRDELRHLMAGDDGIQLERQLGEFSRDKSYVDRIHRAQPWCLMDWREARGALSYRRFFEITGLVGLNVEQKHVFDDVHRLTLALAQRDVIGGLRIDHIDGLADPKAYLKRLRGLVGPDFYIVVEKILAEDEQLAEEWPVHGTTGYEFISAMAEVLIDRHGYEALENAYRQDRMDGAELESERRRAKLLIVRENFAGELARLALLAQRAGAEFQTSDLETVLSELIAAMPVYRTYGDRAGMNERDRKLLASAAETVRRSDGGINRQTLEWYVLSLAEGQDDAFLELRRRFQQLSGAVMAKAVEDTLFYRWNAMIALNEVGCDPTQQVGSVERFHRKMLDRFRLQPHALLATATHDTKHGEDARTRLYALSEHTLDWSQSMQHWRSLNHAEIEGPSRTGSQADVEWLIYQSLASIWPIDRGVLTDQDYANLRTRVLAYIEKALREAKLHTSWTDVNEGYEASVRAFLDQMLAADNRRFFDHFETELLPIARAGWINSLAQTLIKLTAPGVPDIYQGSETGDFSLVDPDNRRRVDFESLAHELTQPVAESDASALSSGRMKQRLIALCLAFRRIRPALFSFGTYEPLQIRGLRSDRVIAYLRRKEDAAMISVAPRLTFAAAWPGARSKEYWRDTRIVLPTDCYSSFADVLSRRPGLVGSEVLLSELVAIWPVAFLANA